MAPSGASNPARARPSTGIRAMLGRRRCGGRFPMPASRSPGFLNNWVARARVADGFAVLGVAGRFAVAVPLAETMMAGWLLRAPD